jgi:hypothetical protein
VTGARALIDRVLDPGSRRSWDMPVVDIGPADPVYAAELARPAWESIERSRRPGRPGVRALLRFGAQDVTPLRGTGAGESEPGLLLALARIGGARAWYSGRTGPGRPRSRIVRFSAREPRPTPRTAGRHP